MGHERPPGTPIRVPQQDMGALLEVGRAQNMSRERRRLHFSSQSLSWKGLISFLFDCCTPAFATAGLSRRSSGAEMLNNFPRSFGKSSGFIARSVGILSQGDAFTLSSLESFNINSASSIHCVIRCRKIYSPEFLLGSDSELVWKIYLDDMVKEGEEILSIFKRQKWLWLQCLSQKHWGMLALYLNLVFFKRLLIGSLCLSISCIFKYKHQL